MGVLRIFRRHQEKLGKAKRVRHLIRNCHWSERSKSVKKLLQALADEILTCEEFKKKWKELGKSLTIKHWMLGKSWEKGIVVEWRRE